MKKWIWLSVASIIVVALWSVLQLGPHYFGKSYIETANFEQDYEAFKEQLVYFELDPPALGEEETVTAAEIAAYRTDDGSLADRIREIQDNYDTDIQEAADAGNEELETTLTEQREAEIEAVRNFFQDDEPVRQQLMAERESRLAAALRELEREKPGFFDSYSYYAYELTNMETGETFTRGELESRPVFEDTFSESRPLRSTGGSYDFAGSSDEFSGESDAEFEGTIQISRPQLEASFYANDFGSFTFAKTVLYLLGGAAVAGLVLLLTKLPFEWRWFTESQAYGKWRKWALEIRAGALLVTVMILSLSMDKFFNALRYSMYGEQWLNLLSIFWSFVLVAGLVALAIVQVIWLLALYREERSLTEDLKNSYTWNGLRTARLAFLKKSIGVQMLLLLVIVFAWGAGTMLLFIVPPGIILWVPATLLIGIPALLILMQRFGYLNVLMERTEAMAEGRLGEEIPVRGKSPLAAHAKQLNRLKEGVRQSLSEQAKSERLKTELITNVSHDLRTPLTSIITYTDLMKTPGLSEEERLGYAAILERKSERLKTLIEDLFEVSKMASGNLELDRRRVDFTQLLAQAFAEHAEAMEDSGLDFRVNAPDQPVVISADGQKWWRVLDNLMVNAIKYALPGTRVYVNLAEQDGKAVFVMKNVTRYELGDNTDELFERFKRGDTARQTEGSGLGLAIAQSIVDLHGGSMEIGVDGDLFKVTVVLDSVR